jgi:hypothetical protein
MTKEKLDAAEAYVKQAKDELGDESVSLRVDFVLDLIAAARKTLNNSTPHI